MIKLKYYFQSEDELERWILESKSKYIVRK